MRRLYVCALLLTVIALALAACGGKDKTPPPPSATPVPSVAPTLTPSATPTPLPTPLPASSVDPLARAQIRVVQASPDLPPVNIYLDGANIGRGLVPGSYLTNPLSYQAGNYLLRVVPAGENPDTAPRLLEQRIMLIEGHSLIAIVAGPANNLRLLIADESLDPLSAGMARLTVIQALPDASSVDVQEQGRSVFSGLTYGGAGGPEVLAEGDHSLMLVGLASPFSFDLPLTARYTYTVVLFPGEDGTVRTINFRSRVKDQTRVRIINASPDSPPFDVTLDNTLVAGPMGYHGVSAWTTFPSLGYTLQLRPAGEPDASPTLEKQIALIPNAALDILIYGTADQLRVTTFEEDLSPTADGSTRFVFVLTAPDVLQTSIRTQTDADIGLRPISQGNASRPLDYSAGRETFVFESGSGSSLQEIGRLSDAQWDAGYAYAIVITGDPGEPPMILRTGTGTTGQPAAIESSSGAGGQTAFKLRVVNTLPDISAIDVAFDGTLTFERVETATSSLYHTFDAAPHALTVRQNPGGTVLLDEPLTLPPVTYPGQLVIFVLRNEGIISTAIGLDIPTIIPGGQALVRVFNFWSTANAINVDYLPGEAAFAPPTEVPDTAPPTATPNPEDTPTPPGPAVVHLAQALSYLIASDSVAIPSGPGSLRVVDAATRHEITTMSVNPEPNTTVDFVFMPDTSGLGITLTVIPRPNK